jgi:hypothetical protein
LAADCATEETIGPRLFTRGQALALLKIGETTLFWLQRTGKLKPIRIGSRVLFNATEIERVATHGASLTDAEKRAAIERNRDQELRTPPEKAYDRSSSRGRPPKVRRIVRAVRCPRR